jgi:hypothetical protein
VDIIVWGHEPPYDQLGNAVDAGQSALSAVRLRPPSKGRQPAAQGRIFAPAISTVNRPRAIKQRLVAALSEPQDPIML